MTISWPSGAYAMWHNTEQLKRDVMLGGATVFLEKLCSGSLLAKTPESITETSLEEAIFRLHQTGSREGNGTRNTAKPLVWHHNHLAVTRSEGTGQRIERDIEHLGDGLGNYLGFVLVNCGTLRIRQGHNVKTVYTGQITAVDYGENFVMDSSDGNEIFSFYISRNYLESRGIESTILAPNSGQAPPTIMALLHLSIWAIKAQLQGIKYDHASVERALLELVLNIVTSSGNNYAVNSSSASKTRAQIMELVEEGYKDADFGVEVLAAELQMRGPPKPRLPSRMATAILV